VRYTNPATLGQAEYVHPVAAYDGLIMLVIFVVLIAYWRRVRGRPPEGRVYWAYLLLFGGFRFLTSFLRLDPLFIDGLQEAQLLGLIYAVGGGIMLPLLSARGRLDSRRDRATTTAT
jgi:prolipoprotein diacylglyceryltransferase